MGERGIEIVSDGIINGYWFRTVDDGGVFGRMLPVEFGLWRDGHFRRERVFAGGDVPRL